MTKVTDTQCVLLSAAAKRDTQSLYPLPASLKPGGGLQKSIDALVGRQLVEERETTEQSAIAREDGDLIFGLFATTAGLAAIGIDCDGQVDAATTQVSAKPEVARVSKADAVLELLRRDEGATLAELIAATDWLPPTTRAALTGLRKKNHAIERGKRGATTCYFLRAA